MLFLSIQLEAKCTKRALFLIIGNLWLNLAFGTAQIPDYLIHGKDTIAIFSNPLEQYFDKTRTRNLVNFNGGCASTACWRGYKAFWKIKNDSLFLNKITSCHDNCGEPTDANLKRTFGEDTPFASWVNGNLVAPKGKQLRYVHLGYASIYEKEQIFKIRNGKLKKVKIKTNKKEAHHTNKENQNKEFTQLALDTIFQTIKTKLDWKGIEKSNNLYFCDDEYIVSFNKKGIVKSVKFAPVGDELIKGWWYNILEWKCRKKIQSALSDLELSYININVEIQIEIFYNDETEELELWKSF